MAEFEGYLPLTLNDRLLTLSGERPQGRDKIIIPETRSGADFVGDYIKAYAAQRRQGVPHEGVLLSMEADGLTQRLREAQAEEVRDYFAHEQEQIQAGIAQTAALVKELKDGTNADYLHTSWRPSNSTATETLQYLLEPDFLISQDNGTPRLNMRAMNILLSILSPTADAVHWSKSSPVSEIVDPSKWQNVLDLYTGLASMVGRAAGGIVYGQPELHGKTPAEARAYGLDVGLHLPEAQISHVETTGFVPVAMEPYEAFPYEGKPVTEPVEKLSATFSAIPSPATP